MASLELNKETIAQLQEYVASGEYADPSAVLRDGLRWIRTRVELTDEDHSIREARAEYDEQTQRQILINLDGDVVERIRALVDEQSEFANESAVVSKALFLLEERKKLLHLRKLIAEAEAQFERGEFIRWGPGSMDDIRERARQMVRDGVVPKSDIT